MLPLLLLLSVDSIDAFLLCCAPEMHHARKSCCWPCGLGAEASDFVRARVGQKMNSVFALLKNLTSDIAKYSLRTNEPSMQRYDSTRALCYLCALANASLFV